MRFGNLGWKGGADLVRVGERRFLADTGMTTTVLEPAQWAQMEFALVRLGDQRRTERLVKIATRLAHSPGGTLPQAMPHWSELKAAYRFFSQPKNRYEQILRPHWERTQAACQAPGEYLLIEDTTLLDYSAHPATEELGQIGDGGRGFGCTVNFSDARAGVGLGTTARNSGGGFIQPAMLGAKTPTTRRNPCQSHVAQPAQFQKMGGSVEDLRPPGSWQHLDVYCRSGSRLL